MDKRRKMYTPPCVPGEVICTLDESFLEGTILSTPNPYNEDIIWDDD